MLKKCFDGFADEEGAIPADQVNTQICICICICIRNIYLYHIFVFQNPNKIQTKNQVGGILAMMGMKVKPSALREIIEEIDEDGMIIMKMKMMMVIMVIMV